MDEFSWAVAEQAGISDVQAEVMVGIIRDQCGWHVAPMLTEVRTFDSDGSGLISLRSLHVVDVSEVLVDGVPAAAGWSWSQDGWLVGQFPCGLRKVQVTYSHGFSLDRAAVAVAAAAALASGPAVTRESVGPYSVTYGASAYDAALSRYKLGFRP